MNKKILLCFLVISIFCVNICMARDFNMSYIYGGTVSKNIEQVETTNGVINEVSPSYFDLNDDGSLKLTALLNQTFIDAMHEKGVEVIPFLSNHWDRELGRKALKNREELSNQIIQAIEKYNLDGVNVDIENVTEVDREAYTDLVRLLKEKMPEGKIVAVAVAANPNGYTSGWHGSYDYEKLGQYADYLMLMTYDEHYQGGTPGPVASYNFTENSIKYALKYVPSDKVVLGLAFYGRYWNQEGVGGRAVTFKLIEQIFNDYTPTIRYDEQSRTMIGTIVVSQKQANEDDYIFAAGTYDFYYENTETIKEKLELVEKYNLKGTGSWALGQELPSLWEDTSMWLKDTNEVTTKPDNNLIYEVIRIFKDITEETWSKQYINDIYGKGLMIGKTQDTFGTEEPLTRAETVTLLCRLIDMYNINLQQKDIGVSLTDINNHWAKENIQRAIKLGLIVGYDDNTFKPDKYITREEIVTILDRLNLDIQQKENDIIFTDINRQQWSYNSIISMATKGIINGYDDNTFKPQNNMQRQEIATILYKLCNELEK